MNAAYELLEIKPVNLAAEFKRLVEEGITGLNVTIPFKEKIISSLDALDSQARLIGAVNTIKIENKKTTGFNTDGQGFITHLTKVIGFEPAGKQVSILGAGGAAKAIAVKLAQAGVAGISLFDVAGDKVKQLKLKLTGSFPKCPVQVVKNADGLLKHEPALLINATPLGMHEGDGLIFDPQLLHKKLVVYDLVYNPAQTALLKQAKNNGCAGVFNGIGMLLYQGAEAFKVWLDTEAPIEVMQRALSEALANK